MRLSVLALATAAMTCLACGTAEDPVAPSPNGHLEIPTGNPVVVEPVWSQLVEAPPRGATLRDGQVIEVVINFHLPISAYPTSVHAGIFFKNKLGGSSGVSGCIQHREQYREMDTMTCRMTVDGFAFRDDPPGYGIPADGRVDVDFIVFNWDGEKHPGEVRHNNVFSTGYVFQP